MLGHYQDTQNWYKNCAACSTKKNPTKKLRAPLQSIKTGSPLQIVATDVLGSFPESQGRNIHILVVAEKFTRWNEAYLIPNQEATTIARKQTDDFFFIYQRVHGHLFEVGDLVWFHSLAIPCGQSNELYSPCSGPFRVVTSTFDVTFLLHTEDECPSTVYCGSF